jgi:hypothetical protein
LPNPGIVKYQSADACERPCMLGRHVGEQPSLGSGKDVAHVPAGLYRGPNLPLRRYAALGHQLLELIEYDRDGSLL